MSVAEWAEFINTYQTEIVCGGAVLGVGLVLGLAEISLRLFSRDYKMAKKMRGDIYSRGNPSELENLDDTRI